MCIRDRGYTVDEKGFEEKFAEHKKKSQAGSTQRFKGGLADTTEASAQLHTATHLLLASPVSYTHLDVYKRQEMMRFTVPVNKKEARPINMP